MIKAEVVKKVDVKVCGVKLTTPHKITKKRSFDNFKKNTLIRG